LGFGWTSVVLHYYFEFCNITIVDHTRFYHMRNGLSHLAFQAGATSAKSWGQQNVLLLLDEI